MEKYFSERSLLFNAWSEFSCPDDCERIGCKHPDLHISVTIIDLFSISLVTGQRVCDLFEKYIKIGFDPIDEKEPFFGRISLELKKPCHFLEGKNCSIYPGRPIACALFPESCFLSKNIEIFRRKEIFKNFPCIQVPCNISQKRKETLYKLLEMWDKEIFLSDFYLFGVSPFWLDLKNLSELVLKDLIPLEDGRVKIVNQCIEGILFQRFFESGYWSNWKVKLERLDKKDGLSYLGNLKSATDHMIIYTNKTKVRIAHQFDGIKIRQIHLP